MALGQQLLAQTWKKASPLEMGAMQNEDCFLNPFVHRRTEVAHPESTKVFLKLSPETAMLSAPLGTPTGSTLSAEAELPPKLKGHIIAGSDITR